MIVYKNKLSELNNIENYKYEIGVNINDILSKYKSLIIEYIELIFENIKVKNITYLKFIIIRGLNTINSVFNFMLHFTKNIEITYSYSQKAIYFYVEFISQIINDENILLQLNTKDAIMYVYKKTIFEINKSCVRTNQTLESDLPKITILKDYIIICENILLKILNNHAFIVDNLKNMREKTDKKNHLFLIKFDKITEKLIQFFTCKKEDIKNIHLFINRIDTNISNVSDYLDCIFLVISKIKKINSDHFKNKILSETFDDYILNKNMDQFIKWIVV